MFDKMLEHLRAQGCRSVDEFDSCLYRGPNGTKCAVGALIPDEKYSKDMEDISASGLLNLFPDFEVREFLTDCQM